MQSPFAQHGAKPPIMWMKAGIESLMSSKVCKLTAALALRKGAHSNRLRHRSMVVASNA